MMIWKKTWVNESIWRNICSQPISIDVHYPNYKLFLQLIPTTNSGIYVETENLYIYAKVVVKTLSL